MNNTCLIESTQWDPKLRILLNGPMLSGLITRLTHARSTHTLWTDTGRDARPGHAMILTLGL